MQAFTDVFHMACVLTQKPGPHQLGGNHLCCDLQLCQRQSDMSHPSIFIFVKKNVHWFLQVTTYIAKCWKRHFMLCLVLHFNEQPSRACVIVSRSLQGLLCYTKNDNYFGNSNWFTKAHHCSDYSFLKKLSCFSYLKTTLKTLSSNQL